MNTKTDITNTDLTDNVAKPKSKFSNRNAKDTKKQKRIDSFRREKTNAADAAIMAGIYARLKISDPTSVPSTPIKREVHPVTVEVQFNHIPEYIDRTWDTMEAIGTKPFQSLNTLENKEIFIKSALILNEAKVCYAQRAHIDKPDEDLTTKNKFSEEQLININNIAETLPLPLAIQLETLGNTIDNEQVVTPITRQLSGVNQPLSGVVNYAPTELAPVISLLADGVPRGGEVHEIAQAMDSLPHIQWEEYNGPAVAPAAIGPNMVRLTANTRNFWLNEDNSIKWTDYEQRVFKKLVQSMGTKKGFNIKVDLSHGQGTLAQTVRVPHWRINESSQWYTMTNVSEYDQKLGVAFGYGSTESTNVSKYNGNYRVAYWRGELTPIRVIRSIMSVFDNVSNI